MDKDRKGRRVQRGHSGSAAQEPSAEARQVVLQSPLAVMMLQLPSERIVAASPAARSVIAAPDEQVEGRLLSEFIDETPTEAEDLLARGRLNGYQTSRSLLPGRGGTPLTVWVRAIGARSAPRYVVALLFETEARPPSTEWPPASPVTVVDADTVVGTTSDQLVIDRISENVHRLLGDRAIEVIGRSLLRLAHPDDLPSLLRALAESTSSEHGVTLRLRVLRTGQDPLPCQLVLLPLSPAPTCVFALESDTSDGGTGGTAAAAGLVSEVDGTEELTSVDSANTVPDNGALENTGPRTGRNAGGDEETTDPTVSAAELERMLSSLRHGVEAVSESRELTELDTAQIPGLSELTSREFDIVTRLLAGDRAPAIAGALFISKSTVRNHLSSVFAKLGVRSQQELIVLLRRTQLPPPEL